MGLNINHYKRKIRDRLKDHDEMRALTNHRSLCDLFEKRDWDKLSDYIDHQICSMGMHKFFVESSTGIKITGGELERLRETRHHLLIYKELIESE